MMNQTVKQNQPHNTATNFVHRAVMFGLVGSLVLMGSLAGAAEPRHRFDEWLNEPLPSQSFNSRSYESRSNNSLFDYVADPFVTNSYDSNSYNTRDDRERRDRAPDDWRSQHPEYFSNYRSRIEQTDFTRPIRERYEERPNYERSYYDRNQNSRDRDQNLSRDFERTRDYRDSNYRDQDYRNRDFDRDLTRERDFSQPRRPVTRPATPSPEEERTQKIAARYGNPVVGRFIMGTNTQQALRLYQEATRLIDSRHIKPTSYAKRVENAMANLSRAIESPEFLAANHLSPSRRQIGTFQSELRRIEQTQRVNNATDSLNVIYQTINMAQQTVGMKGSAVVTEFVFAATETLDKYSAFVPEDNYRKPSATLEDHIVGIGVEIKPNNEGSIKIVKALRGGPAATAGLKKGDIITSINGRNVAGQSLDWVVDQITGREGSRVTLGLMRGERRANVTLTRSRITIHSVSEVNMVNSEVGYIKLDKFAKSSTEEMNKALWSLHNQGMKSLVIDLRGNPGGLLTTAIELSNKFLPSGTIVSTRGRTSGDMSKETASHEQTWKTPLVVLVDKNSASASEIFAAAIQENGRGLVVGERSYGKGTVQTHFPLQSVSGNLRITTAKFYSPNGREMAGAGVEPDIRVNNDRYTDNDEEDLVLERATDVSRSPEVLEMAASKTRRQQNRAYPSLSSYTN